MLNIGAHLSASKGFLNMAKEAERIGANTFQFFTRNPRGFAAKKIDMSDIQAFLDYIKDKNFAKILAHAPYTLNPCSADDHVKELAMMIMKDDIQRMELVPHNYYNFHPGSHVGQGSDVGIKLTSSLLKEILPLASSTTILIETMAGKGSEIGKTFEEIAMIIEKSNGGDNLGVCLDTCHIFDGGYDIVNKLDDVIDSFDKIIGLNRLKAIHLNDSKNIFESHKDRHEKIGEGNIGLDAISRIINHPKLKDLPFFLETPNELDGYRDEIKLLRSVYKYSNE